MHPRRYELHDALTLYSYLDQQIYTPWEWKWVLLNRLFWLGPRESMYDLKAKIAYSTWHPETTLAIKKIIGSVYGSKCVRSINHPGIEAWLRNVDGLGKSMKQFSAESTLPALIYGTSYTLVDMPKEVGEVTNAAEQEEFLTPILTNFKGIELVNYRVSHRTGELEYCMFVVMIWKDGVRCWRRYCVDKKTLKIYESPKNDRGDFPELVSESKHNLGFVPVIAHYGMGMDEPMIGRSFALDTIDLDVQKFRADSNLSWMSYQAIHAQMVVKSSRADVGDAYMSSSKYIKLKPDEDVSLLEADNGAFKLGQDMSEKWRKDIARAAQFDPLGDFDRSGTLSASGKARQISMASTFAQALRQHADVIAEYETALLRMVYRIVTGDKNDEISVTYPDDFSVTAFEGASSYLDYKDIIQSPSWHKHQRNLIMSSTNGLMPELNEQCAEEENEAIDAMAGIEVTDENIDELIAQDDLDEETKMKIMKHLKISQDELTNQSLTEDHA